ncbi:MAG: biopolymer transporter ExbD [Gemmataceae bacterium]|nr:biopolymer transporter ExbD [Planctomycetia bacterium]MBX3397383.1 biopolymer transporter ExbD [Gemmataceae bacterium]
MRHRHRGIKNGFVEPDLPITPMLDMSFQLLAFFITTFNPTPTEGHIDVGLPKAIGGPSTKLPDPTDAELIEDITIRVDSDENGDIAGISLMQGEGSAEVALPGKGTQARANLFAELKKRLASLKASKKGEAAFAPPKIKLELPDNLRYKILIAIMDESNRAGYTSVAPVLKDDKK